MAKIETANLQGIKTKHANVSDVVGIGGKNERNDVMLIQSLFKIVGSFNNLILKELFGYEDSKELPDVTGVLDDKTIKTIWNFQLNNARRLLSVDGKVHPASYQNRLLKEPYGKPVMMITRLNIEAEFSANQRFKGDLMIAVKNFAPSIMFV